MIFENVQMPRSGRQFARRRGFTYLELEVSFLLFAIALGGLAPLTVMQSRQVRQTESRLDADETHYISPSAAPWASKLGAAASVSTDTPPPKTDPVLLIDNGDPGYTEDDKGSIDWQNTGDATAFGADSRRNNGRGDLEPLDQAIWSFAELQPGAYEVFVTYRPIAAAASNAPYYIYEGEQLLNLVRVDQTTDPSGASYLGSPWDSLGTVTINGTSLRVQLADNANGNIIADAVRIAAIRNEVLVVSMDKSLDSETVSAVVSVTGGAP